VHIADWLNRTRIRRSIQSLKSSMLKGVATFVHCTDRDTLTAQVHMVASVQ